MHGVLCRPLQLIDHFSHSFELFRAVEWLKQLRERTRSSTLRGRKRRVKTWYLSYSGGGESCLLESSGSCGECQCTRLQSYLVLYFLR